MQQPSILLIYTGGTIGMIQDARSGTLKPFNFSQLIKQVPELERFKYAINTISFKKPIDSSNMNPIVWAELAKIIGENYKKYDGFVILHGSDTMAYTASALSFMLEGLKKPVVLTGSQLPIGVIRTDGKENLITAIEIAASKKNNIPIIQEVVIYFEYTLLRGNRTTKFNSEHFDAFISPNYEPLAEAGIQIKYNQNQLYRSKKKNFYHHEVLENDVAVIKLFPGLSRKITESILSNTEVKAIIIESFGSGNAPTDIWFIDALAKAIKSNKIILNITQCAEGAVDQGKYETSIQLKNIGVISGGDMTFEAAITKLMFLLGTKNNVKEIKTLLQKDLCGELTNKLIV